jgi:Na+/H+-dicarboxylate symporter
MQAKVQGAKGVFQTCIDVLVDAVPSNPIAAFADMKVLQIIVIAILFGLITIKLKEKSKPVVGLMGSLESISLELTHWIMKFAPVGVFVLMVDIMAKAGFSAIVSLAKYMLTVLVGLLVHAVILVMFASFRLKKTPWGFLRDLSMPLLTAFSTASSAATLPVTMMTVQKKLGVKEDSAKFVLPLGATINMDGTALYESVAAIFIAQAYGIDLGVGAQLIIFLTASLAAVGAAAIPGAGLVTMSIVLTAVGLPLEGIGIILAVDRILDMFRTTVNVLGDCVGTVYVDSVMEKA